MKSKPQIILIGGGGHCKSVIDVIEAENRFIISGIVDLPEKEGQQVLDYTINANDSDLPQLVKEYKYFFITIGQLQSPGLRIKFFSLIENLGGIFPEITSPYAYVSKRSKIDKGTIIMHNTVINTDAQIGYNCIVNNKSLIEHDSRIGNNCHISTNSVINGGVIVGDNCVIGSNAVTKQYIKIASNTIIGGGAVVTKDITESGVYTGNPARLVK